MKRKPKRKSNGMQSISQALFDYAVEDKGGRITKEFQDYGYRLAMELHDKQHVAMYIKLAKEVERPMMERARTFVKDARDVRHKGRLFMWALAKIRKGEDLYEKKDNS